MPIAELTDVRCYYEVIGQGEPLVLIPGLGSTSAIWQPVLDHFSTHLSVVRFDNRDIGQSVGNRHPNTISDYSSDLIELLDHLQIDRAHVMGLSLGGIIAQRLAIDYPARIDRLILVSCTHEFGPYLREITRLVGQTLRWFPRAAFARTMEILGAGPTYLDAYPERIEKRLQQISEMGVPGKAIIRQLRALAASNIKPNEYHIQSPTLVISGEYDTFIPNCYARDMAKLIEDSNFMIVPEAGHNPFLDCPDRVLPVISQFLETGLIGSIQKTDRSRTSKSNWDSRGAPTALTSGRL